MTDQTPSVSVSAADGGSGPSPPPPPSSEDARLLAPPPAAASNVPSLDAPHLYQNARTGSASTVPLTVRQLCRLLCPASASSSSSSGPASAAPTAASRILTPETCVIGFDPTTGTYSEEGWVPCRNVPVLREAGAAWYYESAASSEAGSGDGGGGGQQTVKGPVTARDLARMLSAGGSADADDGGDGEGAVDVIDGLTRVWSSELGGGEGEGQQQQQQQQQQWRSLSDLPLLRMALDAFEDASSPWSASELQKKQFLKQDRVEQKRSQTNGEALQDRSSNDDDQQQTFDPDAEESTADGRGGGGGGALSKQEADDLEAFLSSTAVAGSDGKPDSKEEEDEEEYESDGGTPYVKDPRTGNWVHADLVPTRAREKAEGTAAAAAAPSSAASVSSMRTVHHSNKAPKSGGGENGTTTGNGVPAGSRKRKKKNRAKFAARNARCWVYVTGLPYDTDEDEVAKYFGRVGVLDLDPETQHPKVKLYRRRKGDDDGSNGGHSVVGALKGDGSVCYARPESVDLALQFLDESSLRPDGKDKIRVERAKFEQHGTKFEEKKGGVRISEAKRKVARLAALQAVGWDEGENGRITGGLKGLRIIVLKRMFDLMELQRGSEDKLLADLEKEVRTECEQWGVVEKITVFAKNPAGVMVIKFAQPTAASTAVSEYHGRMRQGRKIDASFWDGVTDFTVREEEKEKKEEAKRHDEFGKWLDEQEDLPEEFRLQVEG